MLFLLNHSFCQSAMLIPAQRDRWELSWEVLPQRDAESLPHRTRILPLCLFLFKCCWGKGCRRFAHTPSPSPFPFIGITKPYTHIVKGLVVWLRQASLPIHNCLQPQFLLVQAGISNSTCSGFTCSWERKAVQWGICSGFFISDKCYY